MDAVVETMGLIGPYEATPLTVGPLPLPIQSICNTHVVNQELTVDAAMNGDRRLCLQVLYNDPLIREFDYVPQMLEEMLEANRAYLPRFFGA
jgi:alpha-galactosidase/6-phospho-beta-glucosidase family protein